MELQEHQALAILAMAADRNEYNFGVLAMLGKFDLAVEYGAPAGQWIPPVLPFKTRWEQQAKMTWFTGKP